MSVPFRCERIEGQRHDHQARCSARPAKPEAQVLQKGRACLGKPIKKLMISSAKC